MPKIFAIYKASLQNYKIQRLQNTYIHFLNIEFKKGKFNHTNRMFQSKVLQIDIINIKKIKHFKDKSLMRLAIEKVLSLRNLFKTKT